MRRSRVKKNPSGTPMRRKALSLLILLILAAAALLLGVGTYRMIVQAFVIREVEFSGNRHIANAELLALTRIPKGSSLLRMSSRSLCERLVQSPWIRAVSVRKDLPDRLLIQVFEAEPFAILDRRGQSFLVDDQGRLLERLHESPVPFLPVIVADPERMRESYREAISLAGVIKERKIATERGRVEILANGKGPEDLMLSIDSVVIKIGQGDFEQKLDRLFSLEEEIKRRAIPVDYIDLRFANRVVVKPINEVIR